MHWNETVVGKFGVWVIICGSGCHCWHVLYHNCHNSGKSLDKGLFLVQDELKVFAACRSLCNNLSLSFLLYLPYLRLLVDSCSFSIFALLSLLPTQAVIDVDLSLVLSSVSTGHSLHTGELHMWVFPAREDSPTDMWPVQAWLGSSRWVHC